jgi:two-component system, chemotaxis family, CheB/CheR fusion protein
MGAIVDVSERKRAEMSLRESELRTRSILQSALDGVVMMDQQGLVTFWNSQAEVIFGYAASEAVGQPLKDLIIPPPYRSAHVEGLRRFLTKGASTILNQRLELAALRLNGEEFPIELTVIPVRIGDRYEFSAFVRDITERKRSEAHLQELNRTLERRVEERTLLAALLRDVAATCNLAESVDEACSAVLERVCRHLGWPLARTFMVAQDLRETFARSDLWFPRAPRTTLSDVVLDGSLSGNATSGQPEWIRDLSEISDSIQREELGQLGMRAVFKMPVVVADVVVAVLEFFHSEPALPNVELLAVADQLGRLLGRVVERAQLQQAVAESVEAEQRRIGQELHDGIGQELTALSLLSRSIALTLKSEGSSAAGKADVFASSIPQLVRQIRNVIRGLMPVELDADGLMSALQQLADSTQQRHGIRCQLEARRAVPVPNRTVAHHLFRIAQEAINNALKHGQPKSIVLTLQANNSTLDLTVRDDGSGIEVDTARSTDRRPRGMGLRIMRHRARLIGGQLTIQCPSGGGTVVNCTLKGQETTDDEH